MWKMMQKIFGRRRSPAAFHEEAARSQVQALHGDLRPVEKPLRQASIRTGPGC
jgi:hypothetical protein